MQVAAPFQTPFPFPPPPPGSPPSHHAPFALNMVSNRAYVALRPQQLNLFLTPFPSPDVFLAHSRTHTLRAEVPVVGRAPGFAGGACECGGGRVREEEGGKQGRGRWGLACAGCLSAITPAGGGRRAGASDLQRGG